MNTLTLSLLASLALSLAPWQAEASNNGWRTQEKVEHRHDGWRTQQRQVHRHDGWRTQQRQVHRHDGWRTQPRQVHRQNGWRAQRHAALPASPLGHLQWRLQRKAQVYWRDGHLNRWERRDLHFERQRLQSLQGWRGHDRRHRW